MRAVDIRNEKGPADALFINDNVPKPEPKDGEVIVKVKAFGLNRMDLMQREGRYPVPPQAPKTLGVEFSGTVEETAPDVKDFKEGDEVFGLAYGGAYAEYIAVSSKMCLHKPKEFSWEQAAGIPEVWFTAIQAVWKVGEYKKGQSILIHSAASSVSIAAIQLIRNLSPSAIIFCTASTKEKLDFVTSSLGANYGINYKTEDFSAVVLDKTGGAGVDLIIDFVGQSHFQKNLNCAARDGRIVILSVMSGAVIKGEVNLAPILFKRLRIEGSTLRSRDAVYQGELRNKFEEVAMEPLKQGKFKVYVERVFDWKDVVEAHKLMESNKTQGKIICTIDF